eukprot:CAMPEP_0174891868 /NCGR_PEP_ID=MMETSP0167-20121228/6886_1 /TAXON_ID=38298 /ORGANISM="Rhodella maculata, Strain CCMP736" /LENGTH=169 /DNA_ID=CAMNT_0016130177 /DNA_START=30 /DNA_END=539 /DNA_ORIENTATION=-
MNTCSRRSTARPAMIVAPAVMPAANFAVPAVMGAVALAGDFKLRLPNVMMIQLPKISLPKISLPKPSLPKLGGKKAAPAAKAAAPIFVDENPNVNTRAVPAKVNIRAAAKSAAVADKAKAPTLAEVKSTGGSSVALKSAPGWKAFPGRKLPGKNMENFRAMAEELTKGK